MTGPIAHLRLAARSLVRHPTFSAVAVITLALGIGANTAVFTLVDGVLLSPLPFENPDDLIEVRHLGRGGADQLPMSQGLYALYRDQASSIEEIALHAPAGANLVTDGVAERIVARSVTPSFFGVLGVEAALGRTFTEEEGAPGAEPVVILSDGLWRDSFGADPSIVGRTLDLGGTSRQVVGVMPADFGHPSLGATAPSVRGMIVRHGLVLAGVGVATGLVAAGALSSVLASLLYGVSPTDPLTYAAVAAALVVVSVAATWIPAARAAGMDPARALRAD